MAKVKGGERIDLGQIFGTVEGAKSTVSDAGTFAQSVLAPNSAEGAIIDITSAKTYRNTILRGSARRLEGRGQALYTGVKDGVEFGIKGAAGVAAAHILTRSPEAIAQFVGQAVESVPQIAVHIPGEVGAWLATLGSVGLGVAALKVLIAAGTLDHAVATANAVVNKVQIQRDIKSKFDAAPVAAAKKREELAGKFVGGLADYLIRTQPTKGRTTALAKIAAPEINNIVDKKALHDALEAELNKIHVGPDGKLTKGKAKKVARMVLAYFADDFKDPETKTQEMATMIRQASSINATHVGRLIGPDFPDRSRQFNGLAKALIEQGNEVLAQYKANPHDVRFAGFDMNPLRVRLGEIRAQVLALNTHRKLLWWRDAYSFAKIQPVVKEMEAVALTYLSVLPSQARVVDTVQVAEDLQMPGWFDKKVKKDFQGVGGALFDQFRKIVNRLDVTTRNQELVDKNRQLRDAALRLTDGGPWWSQRRGTDHGRLSLGIGALGIYTALANVTGEKVSVSHTDTILQRLWDRLRSKSTYFALVREAGIGREIYKKAGVLQTPDVPTRLFFTPITMVGDGVHLVESKVKSIFNDQEKNVVKRIAGLGWNAVKSIASKVAPGPTNLVITLADNFDIPQILSDNVPPIIQP